MTEESRPEHNGDSPASDTKDVHQVFLGAGAMPHFMIWAREATDVKCPGFVV